jgi:tyrosyl-tRNA synthetase
MDLKNVEFVWSSEIINKESNRYWLLVLDIARRFNVPRIVRCSTIMGRKEQDDLSAAQIFYPCMQCADIFFLKADICQLGMDQRKVNMLAREYCDESKRKFKPVILSHHMLAGLTGEKMAKSDPNSAIFMDDTEQDVKTKIKKCFCEPGNIIKNPGLEYIKYIVLPLSGKFMVKIKDEEIVYTEYEKVESDFASQKLYPSDFKPALAEAINALLTPVRDHFKNNADAKKLMEKVKSYKSEK